MTGSVDSLADTRGVRPSRWLTDAEKRRELAFFQQRRDEPDAYRDAHPDLVGGEGYIDREVLPLVDALNGIDGVCTFQSCCGHRYPAADGSGIVVKPGQLYLRLGEPVSRAVDARVGGLLSAPTVLLVRKYYGFEGDDEPYEILDVLFVDGAVDEAQAVLVPFFRECSASAYSEQVLEGLAERLEGPEPGREPASFACPQPGCAVKFEGHVGDTPMCSGIPPNQHAGRRMHTVVGLEGTDPLTDPQIQALLVATEGIVDGSKAIGYDQPWVGDLREAVAKLRARLAREDG